MSDKVLQKDGLHYPPDSFVKKAHIKSLDEYKQMYDRSISDPEGFWGEVAEGFYWQKKWDKVWRYNYAKSKGPVSIEWFIGGKTNMCYNCLDRHLETQGGPARPDLGIQHARRRQGLDL